MDRPLQLGDIVDTGRRRALLPPLGLAVLLWALLQAGLAAGLPPRDALAPRAPAGAPSAAAVLARARSTLAEGSALLNERDAAPALASDPAWQARHAQVIAALAAEYAEAQALPASPASGIRACVTDGLRLALDGHQLFQQAFANDGHGAYYFSAHANWDLDMAQQRLAACA